MILSAYAQKLRIPISEATSRLLSDGGLNYLEDYYEALHTQSNKGIIQKLEDLETGYYLESSAYLAEVFRIA